MKKQRLNYQKCLVFLHSSIQNGIRQHPHQKPKPTTARKPQRLDWSLPDMCFAAMLAACLCRRMPIS